MPLFSSLSNTISNVTIPPTVTDAISKGFALLPESVQQQTLQLIEKTTGSSSAATSAAPVPSQNNTLAVVGGSLIGAYALWKIYNTIKPVDKTVPPVIPHNIPFFGLMFSFGKDPLKFLLEAQKKYGDVFTFLLFGRQLTYVVGSEASDVFFNAKGADVSAEAAYKDLTVPVFGEGVLYDVTHELMTEQKKMCKGALTPQAFEKYVPIIEKETLDYIATWGDEITVDLLETMSEITIMTASHCLLGKEVRSKLNQGFAKLYADLDGGFTPLNYLFPNVPFPRNIKRDAAHTKIRNLFMEVIDRRRRDNDKTHVDLMQTLMDDGIYKDGSKMSDTEISHLLIAVLLGGQHTSSTTGSWLGFEIAQRADYIQKIRDEVMEIAGNEPLTFDHIKKMRSFDSAIKETLRIHPPLIQIMRLVVKDLTYKNYKIPAGNFICVSPTANHMLPEAFPNPEKFEPERFERDNSSADEEKHDINSRFSFVPFGAGRHRCIGENYAFMQLKTIWATILRHYDVVNVTGVPAPSYSSLVVLPSHPNSIKFVKRQIKN